MPTKKRRVGFIPRNSVLNIISKLSYENNLSYSKIINILVEEALCNRGLLDTKNREKINQKSKYEDDSSISEEKNILNKEFENSFKNKFLKEKNLDFNEVKDESIDDKIYDKFLMFLQFKEKMKGRDF